MHVHHIYKKEWQLTLVAFVVTTVLTHIYPIYYLFPGLTKGMLFGYPAHYFLALVVGWLVLMPLYWIYMQLSEQIDRDIEEAESSESGASNVEGGPR
jgi:putative solute:sodium symporter small subunit